MGDVSTINPSSTNVDATQLDPAPTTRPIEPTKLATPGLMLSSVDWRDWFIGYGIGGCFGLNLLAGVWSLTVDENRMLGMFAIVISLAHGFTLIGFWLKRFTLYVGSATRVSYLVGALGIAMVAWLMTWSESRVPALTSLYSLALMNFAFAFTIPLLAQTNNGTPKR